MGSISTNITSENLDVHIGQMVQLCYSREATKALKRHYWILTQSVDVKIHHAQHHYTFTIPSGFLTDGATVPRWIWSVIPLWDECTEAVVIHDYLCNVREVKINGIHSKISRELVDVLFLRVMEFFQVHKVKRQMIYNAVRLYTKAVKDRQPEHLQLKLEMEKTFREELKLKGCTHGG